VNNFVDYFKVVVVSIIVIICCCFVTCLFLPKIHQGYWLEVVDGRNSSQIIPVYRIVNNWKWYPDNVAFVSIDKDECLRVFNTLKGE